jgi:GntR family transcriptional repressor for pyruvate dehydrogenase complex
MSSSKPLLFKSANKLRPVRRKKLYQDIVEQIQDLIRKGRLRSGDQLPSERELSEIFQVSRNSVREAIRTLEENRVLRSRHGGGTYVNGQDESSVVESLAKAIHDEKNKLSEIFQFRRLVEPEIAFLAAENSSAEEIEELEKQLHDQQNGLKEGNNAIDIDDSLHMLLARASKNSVLMRVAEAVNGVLRETRADFLQSETRRLKSFEDHRKIIEAIKRRDPSLARKTMREHLRNIEQIVLSRRKGE